jgi:hypothetical protein
MRIILENGLNKLKVFQIKDNELMKKLYKFLNKKMKKKVKIF